MGFSIYSAGYGSDGRNPYLNLLVDRAKDYLIAEQALDMLA